MRRRALLAALPGSLAAPLMAPAPLHAQAGFNRPIRLVVPFAPGGTSDILARILAPSLGQRLGQSVVVENRTGASGNLGADMVAKAPPDGHTVLLIDAGILATAPSLFSRLPFDARRDLRPVSMLIYAPYILATHPSLPAADAAGLVAYAKANPGKVNVAHSGIGSANHLTALMLTQHWGIEPTMVPYRGGAAALAAVAAGETNLIVNGATATAAFVQNGTLRGIAVSGRHRLEGFPALPTFGELGWPAEDSGTWQALLLPGATPPALVAAWETTLRDAMGEPEIARRIAELGAEPRLDGPEAFGRWLEAETATWGGIIRAHNISLD
jgi:tripartite-type tricarboxylate transporter receptor subunit TctC